MEEQNLFFRGHKTGRLVLGLCRCPSVGWLRTCDHRSPRVWATFRRHPPPDGTGHLSLGRAEE